MPVFIIDKIKPKNNGVFKLMDTLDINHKGYELEDFLDNLETKLNQVITDLPSETKDIEMDVVNNWICWKYTNEDETKWRQLIDVSNLGSGQSNSTEIYVGNTEPEDEDVKMWVDTSASEDESNVIEIPTKTSELENDMNFITLNTLLSNLSIEKIDNAINLKYGEQIISSINLE